MASLMLFGSVRLTDPNVVTGTFSLNDHFAIVLFDFGVNFSFISTKFTPLLNVKPSIESLGYVIEVAIGMDWLSKNKAEIVCHEKVVRILLEGGEILHVQGERTLGGTKTLMSTREDEPDLSDIPVVRDFIDTKEDHDVHIKLVLKLLKKERLYDEFSKCEFWLQEMHFLGHVDNHNGIYVEPSKIKAVKNWKVPTTPFEIRSFLGLAGRWIELFNNYEYEIHFHRGKANAVANALSRKEQSEGFKEENVPAERLHRLDQQMERKEYESLYFIDHVWVPLVGGVRTIIMDEDDMTRWDVLLSLVEFSYNNSYNSSIQCASFEALYGRKCRSPILWAKIGESRLIAPNLVQKTTDKVVLIKKKLKVARDRQKSYADNRRTPLEFEVGDQVLLKVSAWKGIIRFGKNGKLAPRYVGPYEILERIRPVAYRLRLPEELSSVHDTFHVSNLKKCLVDANLHVLLDEIKIDKTLHFVEEPIEIMDRGVKSLKRSKIINVKVHWYLKRGPKFT
uniref:Putative reverse transcriptase domain-containing protein n=1 Tax=Tanacetum cinerariifolium TaxID=118510 RepID=A0A6L2JBE6_TANCI|nr:putative reverse transcriptase domain-containing protein [Tanacetum cinerariifolium]